MSGIFRLLASTVVALTLSACNQSEERATLALCPDLNKDHVCTVPFELLYSNRDDLAGRNVRFEGILLAGSSRYLLFASSERAQTCNTALAIEVVPVSSIVSDQLAQENGSVVSVAGKLRPSTNSQWMRIDAVKITPYATTELIQQKSCLGPPPPMPHANKETEVIK